MIPKVLFIALFCAAHGQGLLSSAPVEQRPRIKTVVNNWNNVGNTNYVNENGNVKENVVDVDANGNPDVNGDDDVVIVLSPPEINIMVTKCKVAKKDNANNTSAHRRAPSSATVKIATTEPATEQRTQKSGIDQLADKFGQAIEDAVNQKVQNSLNNGGESIYEVSKSADIGSGTILDVKVKVTLSLARAEA